MSTTRNVRAVRIAPSDAIVRRGANDAIYMQASAPLGPYQTRITDSLDYWAAHAPDHTFLAQRLETEPAEPKRGESVSEGRSAVSYAAARARVLCIAQGLVDRKLSHDRPIVILSGNGIEHALLALAAMCVGVPYAPIAPAYSLHATEYRRPQRG